MKQRPAFHACGLIALAAAPPLLGCGGECPVLQACDIRRSECQAHTAEVAVCLSGNDSVRPPVNVVNAESYIEEQSSRAEAEPETDDERAERLALALLNMMPTELNVSTLQSEYWGTVAAFYDPDSAEVTVLDRGQPLSDANAVETLLHEMIHAMQFQRVQPADPALGDDDAGLALSAVFEGEAELYEDLATALGYGYQPSDIDWEKVYQSFRDRSWQQVIESSSSYTMAWRYFPYAFGGAFLHRAWEQGGNAAVRAVFDAPPSSTREIMSGYGADPSLSMGAVAMDSGSPGAWREDPDALGSPILPPTFQPVSASHFGALLFEIFLQRRLNASELGLVELWQGFRGDVFNVFLGPAEGEVILYWRLRFDDDASAAQLMRELDAVPAHIQLAHLQYGRDVAIAASTYRDLTAEYLRNVEWGPVSAPAPSSDAAASAHWWRSSRKSWSARYGVGPSSASDMLTRATVCAGLDATMPCLDAPSDARRSAAPQNSRSARR